ncbi:hypothetical protein LTR91_017342 [Friedmanniomyces endolithicus]|uniref:Cyclin-domain-containing protein n=1 Tax=Friedmanniomyces endolithicus TaxID=329885 RepID=A0AAN6K6Q9_9PEZI|nr:hypothetical protein LTR87_007812 [Friedmanniomyces endolithicus]KAK0967010.1 hypothetical protein LTR91_017342 [Friedmanniomyces endolithicus]KAK0982309.1 hypothetical protein LTS01_011409 [Friedmanniomyces endolithicus]KAK1040020.1 hypothetical protein LTS16_010785 [Friedmanniomyces endolithicus]KAK1077955.1 hypothetical protein LTR33_007650 [Friedmanniomyces endolithicus]
MEDGASEQDAQDRAAARAPPPPPEPRANDTTEAVDSAYSQKSDQPLRLDSAQWDITAISGLAALEMLVEALQDLADAMGDVPPTPPVSRPTTPKTYIDSNGLRRTSSSEATCSMVIGSPEAHPHEPITVAVGADAEETTLQRIAIARRFFSKTAPAFTIAQYLQRLHTFCPHSPGVYLTAAVYCHRLCVADLMVPATNRTIHRLSLAAIRVASKAVEDNKWTQDRISKVGGVSKTQLMNLEVTLCFLLDFDLGVTDTMLAESLKHERAAQR